MKRRVVVTGLGVVSSIGIGKDEFWKNLICGKSGISEITTFDTSDYAVHKGGEVKNFDPAKFIPKNRLNNIGRASQFAIVATEMALEDANLNFHKMSNAKTGVIIGTTMADIQTLEQIVRYWIVNGEDYIWPRHIPKYPANNLSGCIGTYLGLKFINMVIPTACSAGNYSTGLAYDLISKNAIDMAIVGGSDVISRTNFSGFSRLVALSPDKCQPFDRHRKGIIIGEGAAILVLEELELAKKRRANIYAEILGYGLSCDAYHMTAPRVEGMVKAIEKAIKNSKVRKEDIDYISAHGTGTLSNDRAECEAIKAVFGGLTQHLSISSIKSMLGHTMGAASAIEAVACCLAAEEDIVPPTINYETPDSECNIDCVPNVAKKKRVNVALNNSFAFGGNNACLVLKNMH